jgi:peptidoglycan/LPS O-acetylase OafA/YrhL
MSHPDRRPLDGLTQGAYCVAVRRGWSRQPALDGLRGIAILLVLIRHYALQTFPGGGIIGVDLFFVLSGFLITSLLLVEHDTSGRISLGRFYIRRALRLYPALYAMLALFIIAVLVTGGTVAPTGRAFIGAGFGSVYVYNWAAAAHVALPDALGPLWTLSIEEQFYLVWPLVLLIVLGRWVRPTRLAAGLAAAIVVLWLVRPLLVAGLRPGQVYSLTTTWADALLSGALLAVVHRYNLVPRWRRRVASGRVATAATVVLAVAVFVPDLKGRPLTYVIALPAFCVAIAAVLARAVDHPETWSVTQLTARPLVVCGTLSYALYLYNYLVWTVLAQHHLGAATIAVVGVPVTFGLAWLSRLLVERPALRLKGRFEPAGVNVSPPPDPLVAEAA